VLEHRDREVKQKIRTNTSAPLCRAKVVQVADHSAAKRATRSSRLAVRNVRQRRAVKKLEALANPEELNYFRDLEELAIVTRKACAWNWAAPPTGDVAPPRNAVI